MGSIFCLKCGLRNPFRIALDRVSFRYGDAAAPALDQVSFTIPAGGTTAIVGASGSGKTTLLKLLLKLYDPEAALRF